MENQSSQSPIDFSNSLPMAVATAMRRRGYAEWRIAAQTLLEKLNARGLNPKRILITDGWGDEDDWPYFWSSDGQFTLQFFSESQEQGIKAAETIDDVLDQLIKGGQIGAIEDKSFDGGNPYRWIKANTNIQP